MPTPVFDLIYANDRRKHRHRCVCCNRIMKVGERVVMAKVCSKKTKVVHEVCADRESINGWTWRDSLTAWGTDYLRAIGFKSLPVHPMSLSSESRGRAA